MFLWLQVLHVQLENALCRIGENEDSHYEMFNKYAKEKLDQYFGMFMVETPYYYAALVLHPAYKMAWLEDKWRK